ncbi:serine/threonine-protein kinase [Sorangium sp. So ce388]|uniref:serine/threonine-protein kinase n=1 Tax=Sorangium sp. So ce388 TaxID=3133309 RepID=UPI003F5C7178
MRPLGQGGMGSVWVADHLTLGSQVAVKFMAPEIARSPGFAERFRREAMAAAQLRSPHVAQVFDHGVTEDGLPYIVMELLEGEDLKSRVSRHGPIPMHEIACIVRQVAKALGRAHQLGIVHRDIKPDNIFLADADGEIFVKVLDFGVAKQAVSSDQSMTATGSTIGTPLYMSPEQILSAKRVDFRSDLWALGVVGYYAITAQVPFTGETFGALSVAINAGVFTLPSLLRRGVPHAVDAWVTRALQHDPAARFGSIKEMADALDQAILGIARGTTPASGELVVRTAPPSPHAPTEPDPGTRMQVPAIPAPPCSGPQARTFNGLVLPGSGAGRGGAGVLIAGAALASVAAVGLGISWMHGDPPAHEAPAVHSVAARDAVDGVAAPEPPPPQSPEEARAAAPPAASTTPPAPPADSRSSPPTLPAPVKPERTIPDVRPSPRPRAAIRANGRDPADTIGF